MNPIIPSFVFLLTALLPLLASTSDKIVTAARQQVGVTLVIHNIGAGAHEEDALPSYPITGHYRWP